MEFIFELFAFVARKLMLHAGVVKRNKLVKFSLLHLQTVFALLPHFSEQRTSIITKFHQLKEVYGGEQNLLRVLFIQASISLTNPLLSDVVLKEIPAVITELLFGSSDEVCSFSLNSFLLFTKGIFVQWTSHHGL